MIRSSISTDATIDAHCHVGGVSYGNLITKSYPYSQDAMDLVRKMESNNIDYAICFPFPVGEESLFSASLFNRLLLQEAYRFGKGKILPFALLVLNDELDFQLSDIDNLCKNYKIYGVKIYPPCDKYALNDYGISLKLYSFLKEHNFSVVVHTAFRGNGCPSNIIKFAEKYGDIRIMLAHAARFDEFALEVINQLPNVYIDCSPLHMLCALMVRYIKNNGLKSKFPFEKPSEVLTELFIKLPNKLIWGTDAPCTYLTNFQSNEVVNFDYSYTYESEIKELFKLEATIKKQISNINTLNFLFGGKF